MPDISSVGQPGPVGPIDRASSSGRRDESSILSSYGNPPTRPGDRVELSDHARYLDLLRHLPAVRHERVDSVRDAIREGRYETPEKLDTAISRLIEDLDD